MAVMVTELYEALKAAGADDEKAKSAAEAVADLERRHSALERDLKADLALIEQRLATRITESQNVILRWLIPLLGAQTLGILALVARAYVPGGS
jgi:hypothetical protein